MNVWQAARGHPSPVTGHRRRRLRLGAAVAVAVSRGICSLGFGQRASPQIDALGLAGWQAGQVVQQIGLSLGQLGGVELERGRWQNVGAMPRRWKNP